MDAEEDVGGALVELTGEPAFRNIELEKAVARRQRHLVHLRRIPGRDDMAARIGIGLDAFDQVPDLIDGRAARIGPGSPLPAVDRPEIAALVGPFVPDRHAVVMQILDVGVALQEPQQLIDDRPQMQLFGRRDRKALREARSLLRQAGWKYANGGYFSESGEKLEIEFLIRAQIFTRILGPFVENLKALGVAATIRQVDPSQFQSKLEAFDFDVAGVAFSMDATPSSETLQQFFHSMSANIEGAHNYPGIAVPAIDAIIDNIRDIETRDELVTAMKALDRVLRAYHFWIPNWYSANHRIAMWDMFGRAEEKPDYFFPVERLWWYDKEKAAAIGAG